MDTSSSSTAQSTLVGWRAEPQGRGTLGLIATSLSTIFLCTWVVIHPRVHKSEVYAVPHKLALLAKTLLAPEFIAIEGLQEWAQCQRMVSDCSQLSRGEFRLVHAYYISMLALRYQTPGGNRVIWPNQYTWLLKRHFIKWENHADWGLAMDQIQDKSKSDSITKLITLSQVLWFVATCIMRAANDLPLSQLESMTLSYIPLFAITYFFWWNKPKDIFSPSIVRLPTMSLEDMQHFESMALSNKFDETQNAVTYWSIWYLTPRVFEKEESDRMERATLQARSPKASNVDGEMVKSRKEIVVAHWDPYLYRSKTIRSLCCLFGASFGALHLACWNTIFPTTAEMWMWRGSAFVSIFLLGIMSGPGYSSTDSPEIIDISSMPMLFLHCSFSPLARGTVVECRIRSIRSLSSPPVVHREIQNVNGVNVQWIAVSGTPATPDTSEPYTCNQLTSRISEQSCYLSRALQAPPVGYFAWLILICSLLSSLSAC